MTQTLVLLTLNEIQGVRAIVPRIARSDAMQILAVDGGSQDGTVEYLERQGIRCVRQERRGRGEAFRLAAQIAAGDHVVFFSPDGNEDPADISRLFEVLARGADLVIASRFLPGAHNEEDDALLPFRKWANQAFTFIANARWNRKTYVTDTINGYRGIRKSVLQDLCTVSSGFTIEYEMTIHAMKRRIAIQEIPTTEGPRIGGSTKAPSLKTGLHFLRFLAHEHFRCSVS